MPPFVSAPPSPWRFSYGKKNEETEIKMDISLILKITGIGILVAVASQILTKTGRDEQAMFVTVAGIIAALMLLISQIRDLLDMVSSVFGM
jgi:stage III sporulation protein AC